MAIINAAAHDNALTQVQQMHQAMASRAGIEQAKGLLMSQYRCSPEDAFALLVRLSTTSHRKVRDVAQTLIDTTTTPDPPSP